MSPDHMNLSGLGAMDVTKPYEFICLPDRSGARPCTAPDFNGGHFFASSRVSGGPFRSEGMKGVVQASAPCLWNGCVCCVESKIENLSEGDPRRGVGCGCSLLFGRSGLTHDIGLGTSDPDGSSRTRDPGVPAPWV